MSPKRIPRDSDSTKVQTSIRDFFSTLTAASDSHSSVSDAGHSLSVSGEVTTNRGRGRPANSIEKSLRTLSNVDLMEPTIVEEEEISENVPPPTNIRAKRRNSSQKISKTKYSRLSDVSIHLCCFCRRPGDSQCVLGALLVHDRISAHEKCLYFSSGLSQTYDPDDIPLSVDANDVLFGFMISDILCEVRRSNRLRCSHCKKTGASVGCCTSGCPKGFHLPCALSSASVCIHHGNFPTYCSRHRPKLNISRWTSGKKNHSSGHPPTCCVCLDNVFVDHDSLGKEVLHGSCCAGSWVHRTCINKYANSAGLHHMKCPLCGDKDTFNTSLLEMGVWIPDRDASWELEQGAFSDQLDTTPACSMSNCLCPQGRKHHQSYSSGAWAIVSCKYCLVAGAHNSCLDNSQVSKKRKFVCDGCIAIDKRKNSILKISNNLQSIENVGQSNSTTPVPNLRRRYTCRV